jgi:hypothetical protein
MLAAMREAYVAGRFGFTPWVTICAGGPGREDGDSAIWVDYLGREAELVMRVPIFARYGGSLLKARADARTIADFLGCQVRVVSSADDADALGDGPDLELRDFPIPAVGE